MGRPEDIRRRYHEEVIEASSVRFAVSGEKASSQIVKSGLRLAGRHYRVEAYEEARPDALCGRCCRWGHIEAYCNRDSPVRCAICAGRHATKEHGCRVEGCHGKKGRTCAHTTPKCTNCGGPHVAVADGCEAKRAARQEAKGWRSPSPKRRGKEAAEETAPPPAAEDYSDEEEMGEVYHDASASGSEMVEEELMEEE